VGEAVGIQTVELGSLRAEDAIGLVCNFAPMSTAGARKLRSFALASQFYGPLFRRLSEATGAELENIVFTKSKGSYYFVMTPTRRCLAQCGVLRDPAHKPLIARENVDRAALEAFVGDIHVFRLTCQNRTMEGLQQDRPGLPQQPRRLLHARQVVRWRLPGGRPRALLGIVRPAEDAGRADTRERPETRGGQVRIGPEHALQDPQLCFWHSRCCCFDDLSACMSTYTQVVLRA